MSKLIWLVKSEKLASWMLYPGKLSYSVPKPSYYSKAVADSSLAVAYDCISLATDNSQTW